MLSPGSTAGSAALPVSSTSTVFGGKAGLHGRPLVETGIEPAVETDDRRILALVDVDVREAVGIERIVDPAFVEVAAAVRVADFDQLGDVVAVEAAERVVAHRVRRAADVVRKVAAFAELLGVHVDDRVARPHQRVGVGHLVQDGTLPRMIVVAVDERHALAAVAQAIIASRPGWRCGCRASCSAVPLPDRLSTIRQNSGKSSASRLPLTVVSLVLMPSLLGRSRRMYGCTLPDVAVGHFGEHVDRLDRAVEIQSAGWCGTRRCRSN